VAANKTPCYNRPQRGHWHRCGARNHCRSQLCYQGGSRSDARLADHNASRGACETMPDSIIPANGSQRQRRRRHLRLSARAAKTVLGEASNAAASCFPELDPLVFKPCAGAWPRVWFDPMLEELTASLITSRPAGDSLTTESSALSPEPGMPLVTTPRAGQHGIDQATAFTPLQPMASVAYAGETPCCSAPGRKRSRTHVPDSEAVELELLRPIHGTKATTLNLHRLMWMHPCCHSWRHDCASRSRPR
jgi:hypothetical protein